MSLHTYCTNPQHTVSILHELDLGQHTLFLMSDGSLDLLTNDEQIRRPAEHRLHLDAQEAYRLFSVLHTQWQASEREE